MDGKLLGVAMLVSVAVGALGMGLVDRHTDTKVVKPAEASQGPGGLDEVNCGDNLVLSGSLDVNGEPTSDPGVVLQYVQSLVPYSMLSNKSFIRTDLPNGDVLWTYNQAGLNKAVVRASSAGPNQWTPGSVTMCEGLS